MRKNKDTDQLHGNRAADQDLCFRYIIDNTIPVLPRDLNLSYLIRSTLHLPKGQFFISAKVFPWIPRMRKKSSPKHKPVWAM